MQVYMVEFNNYKTRHGQPLGAVFVFSLILNTFCYYPILCYYLFMLLLIVPLLFILLHTYSAMSPLSLVTLSLLLCL